MLLWALISFAGSPKRCFSLSQRGIPADYSVCHSVLQFIAILGFILSHTWSQASFIPFSGISRMEEVAINRRKNVMPAGWVMSEFIMLKFQRLALVLDLAFSVQGTEQREVQYGECTSLPPLVNKGYLSICPSIFYLRISSLLQQRKSVWDRLCRAEGWPERRKEGSIPASDEPGLPVRMGCFLLFLR